MGFSVSPFNPMAHKFSTERLTQSNTLVWIMFVGLPMEFLDPRTLMALGHTIGCPLYKYDTINIRENDCYAMVLCDVDLSKEQPECILMEVEDIDFKFWQKLSLARFLTIVLIIRILAML